MFKVDSDFFEELYNQLNTLYNRQDEMRQLVQNTGNEVADNPEIALRDPNGVLLNNISNSLVSLKEAMRICEGLRDVISASAGRINEISDEYKRDIAQIETRLKQLNLGMSAVLSSEYTAIPDSFTTNSKQPVISDKHFDPFTASNLASSTGVIREYYKITNIKIEESLD